MRNKTQNEIFILENFPIMSVKEIAEYLNITSATVRYYIKKNDLFNAFRFSEEDKKFMEEHYKDMTYSEMAEYLGYTERQVRGKINNMGLTKLRKINSSYFDNIDTSLKAYFIGYIFADGYIVYNESSHNYEFGMELQYGDRYILERLNEELGGVNIITDTEPCKTLICGKLCNRGKMSCLRVYSKNLLKGLLSNGIETNKTLKEVFPIVDRKYFFDFLRGYIDGDGCYWKFKKNYYMHITCATNKVLYYIQNILFEYGIKTQVYMEHDNKYRLMCTNIESMSTLIQMLYKDDSALYLKRKYELIKSYLRGSAA